MTTISVSHAEKCVPFFFIIALLVFLSSCGAGNDNPNTPNVNPNYIELSQSEVAYPLFETESGSYNSKIISVHVRFHGDSLVVLYPNGIAVPPWIKVDTRSLQASNGEFDLPITLTPPTNGSGRYSTSLKFVTASNTSTDKITNKVVKELPISLEIRPLPLIYVGAVGFEGNSNAADLPKAQTIPLNFESASTVHWDAEVINENNIEKNWIDLKLDVDKYRLSIQPTKLLKVGEYRARISISFELGGATGTRSIPLSYTIQAGKPEINYVAPAVGYLNEPGSVILRGVGFDTETIQEVRVGNRPVTSFNILNDTDIRAVYDVFDTLGVKSVEIKTNSGTYTSPMDFIIKDRLIPTTGDFTLDSPVNHMVFDDIRNALIVSTEKTLYRIQLDAGKWSIAAQHSVSVNNIDLSPDEKSVIAVDLHKIRFFDTVTLEEKESINLPPSKYYYGSTVHVLNSGSMVLMRSYADENNYAHMDFTTFNLFNNTLSLSPINFTGYYSAGMVSFDKSKVLGLAKNEKCQNYLPPLAYYYASINVAITSNLCGGISYEWTAFARNGKRILYGNSIYSDNFELVGRIADQPSLYNYVSAISADGKIVYKIVVGDGKIYKFSDSTSPPFQNIGVTTFSPPFNYYLARPQVITPNDGGLLILGGGWYNGETRENRVIIVSI